MHLYKSLGKGSSIEKLLDNIPLQTLYHFYKQTFPLESFSENKKCSFALEDGLQLYQWKKRQVNKVTFS